MSDANYRRVSVDNSGNSEASEYRTTFDPGTESVCERLLLMAASLTDTPPEELPVLHDFIDTDALEALFQNRRDETIRRSDRAIVFTYAGNEIRIESDGIIALSSPSN